MENNALKQNTISKDNLINNWTCYKLIKELTNVLLIQQFILLNKNL